MTSVRSVAHPEDLPELGSAQAAVLTCVSLIAGMCGQPETIVAYWLDLYYQVRCAYEREQTQEAQEDVIDKLRRIWGLDRSGSPTDGDREQGVAEEAAQAKAPGEAAENAEAEEEEDGAEQSIPPREPPCEISGFEPISLKPPDPTGNHYAAEAARFKRETLERLHKLRAGGLTVGGLTELSKGKLTADQVMSILEHKRVPIAVYRVLAKVLEEHFPSEG